MGDVMDSTLMHINDLPIPIPIPIPIHQKRSKMLKYDYSYMQKNRCTEKQENEPKDKKGMSTESVDESSFKFLIITVRLL